MIGAIASACLAIGMAGDGSCACCDYWWSPFHDVNGRAPHCLSVDKPPYAQQGAVPYDYRLVFNYPWSIAPSVMYHHAVTMEEPEEVPAGGEAPAEARRPPSDARRSPAREPAPGARGRSAARRPAPLPPSAAAEDVRPLPVERTSATLPVQSSDIPGIKLRFVLPEKQHSTTGSAGSSSSAPSQRTASPEPQESQPRTSGAWRATRL